MIERARKELEGHRAELTCRDMTRLDFRTGPFDLSINLAATVGHLATDAQVEKHLVSVGKHLRPGALYLLGLTVLEPADPDEEVWVLWESEPTSLPSGGMASVRYESIRRNGRRRRERIRVAVLATDVEGCPPAFKEEYTLRTFPPRTIERLLRRVDRFDLLAVHDMTDPQRGACALDGDSCDKTLVLRRR